ncbi:class IV adenylate cyclase [Haloferacaceae archaeon DSL9]
MYEVEVKVRADHDAVRERLADIDAREIETVEQEDTYYGAPHRDFAETDEALRIRRERRGDDETTKLTYKGPLVDEQSKTRTEHETVVVDGDAAAGILGGLGFEPAATVEKVRTCFDCDGSTVFLDRVSGLGTFVEVEREASPEALDETRRAVFETLRTLGLDPDDQIRTSYLDLLLAGDASE